MVIIALRFRGQENSRSINVRSITHGSGTKLLWYYDFFALVHWSKIVSK